MKKKCVIFYKIWFIISLSYAFLMHDFSNAFFYYFIVNMVVLGALNIIVIHYILSCVKLMDFPNYSYIRHILLTRSGYKNLKSKHIEIQRLFDEYNSLSKYNLLDIFMVIIVGIICPP